MSLCGVCNKLLNIKHPKLDCTDCSRMFHGSCLKMSKADVECITADNMIWRCPPCAETRRKSLRFDSEVQGGKITLDDIMKKINEIVENQKEQEKSFNHSYERIHENLEENTKCVKEQSKSLESCIQIINELRDENKVLKKKVLDLEKKVDEMEQYSRMNAVEIQGVPMQPNEDIVSVVQEVGKAVNMVIPANMIDACHRLGRKPGPNNTPPGIIVKFVRRLDKDELLQKRRVKRDLSTRHMNLPMDQPVYINEALSPARRRLFALARQLKKEKQYKFLWVRGGKIFLRKEEGSHVAQVTCQADLEGL